MKTEKHKDTNEAHNKLDWGKYDWRQFEQICFEYIKTVYSAKFYKTQLTQAQKDAGRDIIIKGKFEEYEAWGECKAHKRNIDLSTIGKNIVLALSHQINKAIFFSVSRITLNTRIEILTVAQEHGFEVLFLDDSILDQAILSCKKVARKYFRKEYEVYVEKNESSIWIDTFLSEYQYAEDAKNNFKMQYHLQNGFQIYLHIFIKNMRNTHIVNLHITLKNINNSDLLFYETKYDLNGSVAPFSDLMHTFRGIVFSPKGNITLPDVEIICTLDNGMHFYKILKVGEVDASDIWKAPYINTNCTTFFSEVTKLLQNVVPENYVRVLYIYGNSGTGKSRLMNEIENKAYESLYRVIHIDFREKDNLFALQDFLMALLSLPSTKYKMNLHLTEFIDTFCSQIDEDTLCLLYDFLYLGNTVSYNELTHAILNVLVNTTKDKPTLISLDNIQELNKDYQILFWNILECCRQISIPVCFSLSHNKERKPHIKHILAEYLCTLGNEKENYILSYKCDALSLKDATLLMCQLLHLTSESEKCIEQVLIQNGTLPIDVLLLAKEFSQEDSLFCKIQNNQYIVSPHILIEYSKRVELSTEQLINNRLENMAVNADDQQVYHDFFSLICLFDGNLPVEIFEECGFDNKILLVTNMCLITKVNCRENVITFYHEKFYVFFLHKNCTISTALLRKLYYCYQNYKNEKIINKYIYIKILVALKKTNEAITCGLAALKYYDTEHQRGYESLLCELLLEMIDPISEPVKYFQILLLQADIWLENVNISEAEKLFDQAAQIIKDNYVLFESNDITHFYHRYVNQKLHTLQYDKAIDVLKVFEKLHNLNSNSALIIDDRYCVALYSLGREKEALEKINAVIRLASTLQDNTWLSIAYSDKAFTYLFNSKTVNKIVSNFKKAIEHFEKSNDRNSISRNIEISIQSAIVSILENNILEAAYALQRSIHTAEKNSHGYLAIPSYNLYAYTLMLQEEIDEAIIALKKGLSYANICSNEKALISIYNNLGNIYVEKKIYPQALEYYKASYQVLKRICLPSNALRYRELICNITKLSSFLNDKDILDDLFLNYSFVGLENYVVSEENNISTSIVARNYGLMSYNGWDYLYY